VANLFDSANYPTTEPAVLIAGDRVVWKRTDLGSDYLPASYQLKYSARLEGDGTDEIEITASESGSDYIVEVAAATSAAWTAGTYHWQAYIVRTSDSERVTVDRGTFEVRANRDSATTDPRSHVKKVLDAIEAVIENRATQDQESYSINGRSLSRTPLEELLKLRRKYQHEYLAELNAENARRGKRSGNTVRVRFCG
jgi:hypothetical protein